nr:response regulator [Ignavibacteriaceae bacterium]
MKAIIVDDERLARNELRRLLAAHPEVEIIEEAANVDEALEKIRHHDPDVVFLDIQMPGKTGFDLLEELD